MSRYLNHSVATNSLPTNSLDASIIESFAQLNLSPDGPFSRLPNELVELVLARLGMQELILIQVVCKKWQAVIYSIGHNKKSLSLSKCNHSFYDHNIVKKRSFGQIDLKSFTHFKLKSHSSEQSQLNKIFPNIASVVMNLPFGYILANLGWLSLNQLTTLSISNNQNFLISNFEIKKLLTLINSCISLKRLDLQTRVFSQITILAPTLTRLEQFSYLGYDSTVVQHFNQNCSRVCLGTFGETINCFQWHTINIQWLTSVTYLQLIHVGELDRVIEYLSQHAILLQVLRFEFACTRITSQLIAHLAKLKHLTDFDTNQVIFDLPQLYAAHINLQLVQLASIRTCTLSIAKLINFTVPTSNKTKSDLFTSVLSTILPNVEHLNITFNSYEIKKGVDAYLSRFPKLQTHSFKLS